VAASSVTVGESSGRAGIDGFGHFRQSEIQHLHRADGPQLDVARLQIRVHHGLLMGRFERLGDLFRNGERFLHRHGPCLMRSASVGPSTNSITR
jgi:hypothetical protein